LLVEAALYKILNTNSGVNAIVAGEIYPGVLDQTAGYPAIAYRVVSRERYDVLGQRGDGIAKTRFRIFSAMQGNDSNSYRTVKNLDEAIRLALQGYAGTVQDLTVSPIESIVIQYARPESTLDFYDDETQTWQVATDYEFWSDDPIPS
jgi:hypothetical protein